jgi:LPS-assembly lipoprotein
MSWCSRRLVLAGVGMTLAGCGFAPVYAPGGGATRLQGKVALADPETPDAYALNRRIESRLGRAPAGAPFVLATRIATSQQDLGTTSAGEITRYRLTGRLAYSLARAGMTEDPFLEAETVAFTGYSATGSSVATLAGERDARRRLMIILADQMVDDLLLAAADLPA